MPLRIMNRLVRRVTMLHPRASRFGNEAQKIERLSKNQLSQMQSGIEGSQ